MTGWVEFDYDAPPPEGLYWVCGVYPEYDVDDYGQCIGIPTGKTKKFVALVEVYHYADSIDFYPLNESITGHVEDDYVVTHYQECIIPAPFGES